MQSTAFTTNPSEIMSITPITPIQLSPAGPPPLQLNPTGGGPTFSLTSSGPSMTLNSSGPPLTLTGLPVSGPALTLNSSGPSLTVIPFQATIPPPEPNRANVQ